MRTKHRQQIAALPVRICDGVTEVLLITSRQTARWIIPKGWPVRGLTPRQVAAREAYEEAGITGRIGKDPIGDYRYDKRLSAESVIACTVDVFLLQVEKQADDWPEKRDRKRLWLAPAVAAGLVEESGLRRLLLALDGTAISGSVQPMVAPAPPTTA